MHNQPRATSGRAGARYVVAVRSGGWRVNLTGGGMLNRGSFLSGVGHRLTAPESSMRAYALAAGTIQIKESATRRVVWQRAAAELPMGQGAARFIDEIEQDLENLTIAQFQRRWDITD